MASAVIMVADRNGNVREFLRRELTAEGYTVWMVSDGHELARSLWSGYPALLVLDPELPLLAESGALNRLGRSSGLPVLIHGLPGSELPTGLDGAVFVEKGSSPLEFKSVVSRLLSGNGNERA